MIPPIRVGQLLVENTARWPWPVYEPFVFLVVGIEPEDLVSFAGIEDPFRATARFVDLTDGACFVLTVTFDMWEEL